MDQWINYNWFRYWFITCSVPSHHHDNLNQWHCKLDHREQNKILSLHYMYLETVLDILKVLLAQLLIFGIFSISLYFIQKETCQNLCSWLVGIFTMGCWAVGYVSCKMAAILFRPQWVKAADDDAGKLQSVFLKRLYLLHICIFSFFLFNASLTNI